MIRNSLLVNIIAIILLFLMGCSGNEGIISNKNYFNGSIEPEDMVSCYKTKNQTERLDCWEEAVSVLGERYGASYLMDFTINKSNGLNRNCHVISHLIGRDAYSRRKSIPDALVECNKECTDGCLHGVLQQAFDEFVTPHSHPKEILIHQHILIEDIEQKMNTVCDNYDSDCVHGLGHAILFALDYNLTLALNTCKKLPKSKNYCYRGVFMENIVADRPNEEFIIYEDYNYPCNNYGKEYQEACYRYQTLIKNRILNHNELNVNKAEFFKSDCLKINNSKTVLFCIKGLGDYYWDEAYADIVFGHKVCTQKLNFEQQKSCVHGMVSKMARVYHDEISLMFCDGFQDVEVQNFCYNKAFLNMKTIKNDINATLLCKKADIISCLKLIKHAKQKEQN